MKTSKLLSFLSAFTFVGALAVAGPALAISETEPNDTPGTANSLGSDPGLVTIDASLTSGDVDFFSVTLTVASILDAFTDGSRERTVDTTLQLLDTDGTTQIDQGLNSGFNDDCSNNGTCGFFNPVTPTPDDPYSGLEGFSLAPGTYFLKVAGVDGDVTGPYSLTVRTTPSESSNVPEPASVLLFVSGLVGLAAWRWFASRGKRCHVSKIQGPAWASTLQAGFVIVRNDK